MTELKYMATNGTLTMKGGTFTGVANRANFKDYGDDVVEPLAWTKGDSPMRVPLLAQHVHADVIGGADLKDDPRIGLVITKAAFAEGVSKADDYRKLVEQGFIDGISVGYSVVDSRQGMDGARYLTALKLWEVSLVTFPMNTLSRVTSVASGKELQDLLNTMRRARVEMVARNDADERAAAALAAATATVNSDEATNKELRAALEALRAFRRTTRW